LRDFKGLSRSPLLLPKKPSLKPSPERASTALPQATTFIEAFKMPAKAGDTGNHLHFAEQIPQLAKSQTERQTQ
jgi:hypothetical protein